jgi:hypothetical protein
LSAVAGFATLAGCRDLHLHIHLERGGPGAAPVGVQAGNEPAPPIPADDSQEPTEIIEELIPGAMP